MTHDYYTYVSSIATSDQQTLISLLSLFLLALSRLLPIILLAPFFGAKVLPHSAKVVLGMCFFVILLPLLLRENKTTLAFDMHLIMLMLKEAFIGFILGFLVSIPFYIGQNAGLIIDHQRGGASLMVNDPTIQNQSSPLGTLFNMVLIYIFFMIDGPFIFFDAIISSYEVVPPDQFLNPVFFSENSPFWQMQFVLLNKVMVLSVQLASPGLISLLMTDLFLGIVNRMAPQVQIIFIGMPIKSLLALAVLAVGWKAFTDQLVVEIYSYFQLIVEFVHSLGLGLPTL